MTVRAEVNNDDRMSSATSGARREAAMSMYSAQQASAVERGCVGARAALAAVLWVGAAGCAAASGRAAAPAAPASAFPSREALAAVKAAPPPQLGRAESYVDVTEWTLVGPFPANGRAPAAGAEPWTAALTQAVASRAGVTLATEGMQCTARELGRFLLDHDKLPSPALREFIAARCGAGVVQLSAQWLTGTASRA
jgi:hypothetical protein